MFNHFTTVFCPLLLGGGNGLNGFGEFIYKSIVPASFVAPMKSTFDMNDAQTVLVGNNLIYLVTVCSHVHIAVVLPCKT